MSELKLRPPCRDLRAKNGPPQKAGPRRKNHTLKTQAAARKNKTPTRPDQGGVNAFGVGGTQ